MRELAGFLDFLMGIIIGCFRVGGKVAIRIAESNKEAKHDDAFNVRLFNILLDIKSWPGFF